MFFTSGPSNLQIVVFGQHETTVGSNVTSSNGGQTVDVAVPGIYGVTFAASNDNQSGGATQQVNAQLLINGAIPVPAIGSWALFGNLQALGSLWFSTFVHMAAPGTISIAMRSTTTSATIQYNGVATLTIVQYTQEPLP